MLPEVDAETRAAYEQLPRHSLSANEIEAGWSAYETHLQIQQPWRDNPAGVVMMLRSLFIKLPNFQRTRVYHTQSARHHYHLTFWDNFRRRTHVHSKTWFRRELKADDLLMLAHIEAVGLRNECLGVKQVEILHLDLGTQEGFRILNGASDTMSGATTEYTPRLENLIKSFEPLTELTLRLLSAEAYTSTGGSVQVQRMLKVARNLRSLDLTYGQIDDFWVEPVSSLSSLP